MNIKKKLTLLVSILFVFNNFAQNSDKNINISLSDIPLSEAIKKIESISKYTFFYDAQKIDLNQKVSFKANNLTIQQTVTQLLLKTNIKFEIKNLQIALYQKDSKKSKENIKKITGLVTDEKGDPIIGASVKLLNSDIGTVTDIDGKFEINVPANGKLIISYIGYNSLVQPLEGETKFKLSLSQSTVQLSEVVAIGYGTVKREEITNSVVHLKSNDLIQGNVVDPLQLLQGKVAGMGISRTSGDPTGGVSVMLRGISTLASSSSPLVVIDGIVGGSLNAISPEDIETIDILKDGSAAAIYGTRGTNGVIIITTKRPKAGIASIEYHSYLTVDEMIGKNLYPNANEFRQLKSSYSSLNDFGSSTDWVKEVTRTPLSQNHYISLRGGSQSTNYTASVTYNDKEGIFKNSSDQSITSKFAVDHSMLDGRIKINLNLNDKEANQGFIPSDLYSAAVQRNPTLPVYNEDGSYYENANGPNPVGLLNECIAKNKYNQLMMNAKITIEPIKNFKLSATGSMMDDYNNYEYYTTHKAYVATFGSQNGEAALSGGHGDDETLELQADYFKTINKHSIQAIVGYSYNDYIYQQWAMNAYDFPIDGFGAWNIGAANSTLEGLSGMSSSKYETKLIGFYGRINYNYEGKYLLMASLRREGSDKFGANYRWGMFPAVSAAWRIANETFMKNVKWINDLKLRVGYGITGTAPSSPYQYLALYNFNSSYMAYSNGKWTNGIVPSNSPNPNLKWEQKNELNIGVDFSFLDKKIYGSFDAYSRITKDLLYNYTVPTPPNISSNMLANVGSISNNGIELTLGVDIINNKDFKWSVNGNASYNKNKLISMSNSIYSMSYLDLGYTGQPMQTYTHRLEDGWAIGDFYGWKVKGLTNGGTKWIIVGAENTDAGEDQKTIIGNGIPKVFSALQTSFRYKRFDLMLSFRGAFFFDILNATRMEYETLAMISSYNVLKSAYQKVDGYNILAPAIYSDRYIEKGDYVKLDNASIGYSLDVSKIKFIKDARIYLSGMNLLTFTKYSGTDPEVEITGLTPGIDNINKYPTIRSFLVGLNINL
jgi:TonB-linked SusC/RagA family outer membrane protein